MRVLGKGFIAAAALCALLGAERAKYFTIRIVGPLEEIRECHAAGDYVRAAQIIERELRINPDDPNMHYNAACTQARLGHEDAAAAALLRAIKTGFRGWSKIRRDPDLAAIRNHPMYRALLDARDAADDLLIQRQLRQWRERLADERYLHQRDDSRRIQYLAALPQDELDRVRMGIDHHCDLLVHMMFERGPSHWLLLLLPGENSSADLIERQRVHGVYRHDVRELIALDTGIALRHELVHWLHHQHMDRLGQQHPMWIQEGLATLFEQYALVEGELSFHGGERQRIANHLRLENMLLSWRDLFAMNDELFQRQAHRTYAQAHSIMLFLVDQADISVWYRCYVANCEKDPTGAMALQMTLGAATLDELEARWIKWLSTRPVELNGGLRVEKGL